MDAYLVLVMPTPPAGPLREWVQRTELDTKTCRRHVVWPQDGDGWERRLDEVTVLALPTPGRSVPGRGDPKLPTRAVRVLEMITAGTSIAGVVQQVRAEADSTAEVP